MVNKSKNRKVELSPRRAELNSWYKSKEWRLLRRSKLKESPLCEACRMAPASHVDHIRAHKGDRVKFLDEANLQSLCHSCHSAKTILKDGGAGQLVSDKPVPGTDVTGWPIARDHHWNRKK